MKSTRLRKATKTRAIIRESGAEYRLSVHKSNQHIYAQLLNYDGSNVVASASTLEKEFEKKRSNNIENSKKIGSLIAKRALEKGIKTCAFDRSGYPYHGKIKALADSARQAGLKF